MFMHLFLKALFFLRILYCQFEKKKRYKLFHSNTESIASHINHDKIKDMQKNSNQINHIDLRLIQHQACTHH